MYIITLYSFLFQNVTKYKLNDETFKILLMETEEENVDYNLQWSIKVYASPYKCGTRKCDLCLTVEI